jgi:hypothetical protein
MLYEMVFLGKIQRAGKTAPDKPFLKSLCCLVVLNMRPTPGFDDVFAGFLIRRLLALPARLAAALGSKGVFRPLAFCALFRPLPVRHRAFFYGPAYAGRFTERVPAVRPGL